MVLFCRKEYFMKQELLAKMNAYLANQEIMYIKLHNMHWNLKGHGFFTLHSKLEEYYDQTAEIIDEVAERILAKDALPIANLKEALEISKVKELPDKAINIDEAIRILTIDVEYWVNDSKEIVELADKEGDVVTSDIFTGYVKEYEKTLWMLKVFAQN